MYSQQQLLRSVCVAIIINSFASALPAVFYLHLHSYDFMQNKRKMPMAIILTMFVRLQVKLLFSLPSVLWKFHHARARKTKGSPIPIASAWILSFVCITNASERMQISICPLRIPFANCSGSAARRVRAYSENNNRSCDDDCNADTRDFTKCCRAYVHLHRRDKMVFFFLIITCWNVFNIS